MEERICTKLQLALEMDRSEVVNEGLKVLNAVALNWFQVRNNHL